MKLTSEAPALGLFSIGQTLEGSFSALSKPDFASQYSLELAICWKALAEIYTMHSFAPFSNLNFFVKNRQNFFAIELMNIH